MTLYDITFADSVRKDLRNLPKSVLERVYARIRNLAVNPRPDGSKKLHGYKDAWRIRVGDYRVVFTVDDNRRLVHVARVAHRKDVYEP